MNTNCASCLHMMQSHDKRAICRQNGLEASPANADGCKKYMRETGSDDEPMEWHGGCWLVKRDAA